ncbi:MAG: response regulator [Myxococcota bacterium]|nr:response regulator [Myxococcota bacterium]
MQTKAKVPGRILVVDDERSALQLLDRVLSGAGHQVVLAETGELGLQRLAKERFDLLIVDKNLPGIDGLEVLRLARTQHPGLQAIMITGFPTPETKQTGRELGLYAYVVKPFGILEIVTACDAAIASGRETVPAQS